MMVLLSHTGHQLDPCSTFNSSNSKETEKDEVSQFPFPNDLWLVKPWWEITIKVLVFLPVVIGGIVGNAAVLNAVRKNRLLRLSPLNIYIANMAACDLCTLLIGPWLLMCIDSFQNFVLGSFFCKTEGFFQSKPYFLFYTLWMHCRINFVLSHFL